MKRTLRMMCWTIVLQLWGAPSMAAPETLSKRVASIVTPWVGYTLAEDAEFECDVPVCEDVVVTRILSDLVDLPAETKITEKRVVQVWERLLKTGYFSHVTPKFYTRLNALPEERRVYLSLQCTGAVVIQSLNIEYADWQSKLYPKQFVTEIRKRLPLRRGGLFPGQVNGLYVEGGRSLIESYQSKVLNLYERQGFIGTRVEIIPRYYGPQKKKVDVKILIHEGSQPELGGVLFKGLESIPYWQAIEPLSTGERADFWRDIFGLFGVGRFERKTLKEELEILQEIYRNDGWVSARVRLEPDLIRTEGKVYPKITVREGSRLSIRFEGNDSLTDAELMEVMSFAENGSFDSMEIEESSNRIKGAYQAAARYFVQVDVQGPTELEDNHYQLVFKIDEGPRVYARKIDISGHRRLSEKLIKATMTTQGVAPDGVLNALTRSGGIVQNEQMIDDLTQIRDLYRSKGMPGIQFRCARKGVSPQEWSTMRTLREEFENGDGMDMGPAMFAGQFDVWSNNPIAHHCFQVIPDHDARLVVVKVELDEGLATVLNDLEIDALIDDMDDQMQVEARNLLVKQGFMDELANERTEVGLTRAKIDAIKGFLLRDLHQRGYLTAKVWPECTLEDGQVLRGKECSESALYGQRVDVLSYGVTKGVKTTVTGILLRGNLHTRNSIIRDEILLKSGEPLGTDGIFLSQANLRSLGVFSGVSLEQITHQPISPDTPIDSLDTMERDATIVVTVEENDAKLLDAHVGLQIDSTPLDDDELPVLYTIGTSARHRNLLGRALELGLGFSHSNRVDQPTEIEADDARWKAGPFFKDRRFFGTRLDLAVEALYQRGQTDQRDAYQEEINTKATVGFDFYNLSYPALWGKGLRATLTAEFLRERLRALTRQGERPPFSEPTQSVAISPALSWDKRDSPLHPTDGFLLSGQAEFVFPELVDIEDIPIKLTAISQYVHSFFKKRLIFVPSLRVGAIWTNRKESDLQSDFFFKAGGDGVALPVRGYEDASIDACNGIEDSSLGDFCEDVYPPGVSENDDFAVPETIGGKALILGSFETRFPSFVIDDVWLAAFTDVGAIARGWQDLRSDNVHSSVGGGVRWLVSGQIPLRLDLAYPLTSTRFSEQNIRIHLNIFYTL